MSDAVLYRNSNGKDVTHASYSSRQTFRHCPREFELTRVEGWWGKEVRAATYFGRCIEAGLQAYEESGRTAGAGVTSFRKLWADVKTIPEFPRLKYTEAEGSWDPLNRAGWELMRLYEIRAHRLPIVKPQFQQTIRKKIFPGTNLDKLENKAILDILSFPAWNHPMLTKADPPQTNEGVEVFPERPLIIDVKTAGKELATDLVALDPQLAEYAWQTRIPDVGFLWFVKRGLDLERGSKITLLEDTAGRWAGWEGYVIEIGDPLESGNSVVYIGGLDELLEFKRSIGPLRGKARDAAKAALFQRWFEETKLALVTDTQLTKQRLQFATARLSEQDMDEVGRSVAQTTVEMVRAHEMGFYERQPGIRFPNEKCNFCAMRWICLNKPKERDENLSKRGEEWLDGIQDEGNE